MIKQRAEPQTLVEAIRYFADKDLALQFVARLRWPSGIICPECRKQESTFLATRRLWKCRACKKQFSVKVGTIFEDSPLGLDKWLPALWMLANCKNGISSYELARGLGVTQKTAWFMLHRIRLAMQSESFDKMSGEVEVDETYIGGSARFMHKKKRDRIIGPGGTGMIGKAAVRSLLKRGIKGTYVAVEPFHLFRYLDEQVRRFNERKGTDRSRFVSIVRTIVGRRVPYAELTGANLKPATT
jgi:transposase-like protein